MKSHFFIVIIAFFACQTKNGQARNDTKSNVPAIGALVADTSEFTMISNCLVAYFNNRIAPFQDSKYDSLTSLAIDSIMFDSSGKKVGIFVIVKNPASKLVYKEDDSLYYYDAFFFIGKKLQVTWDLRWVSTINLTRYSSKKEISSMIRFRYFHDFANYKDGNNQSLYQYNVNDSRFWTGPVWDKFFK